MGPPVFNLRTLFEMAKGERKPFELQFGTRLDRPRPGRRPNGRAAVRILGRFTKEPAKEEMISGRKVVILVQQPENVKAAVWAEGKHAVFVYGNHSVDAMVQKIKDSRTGITTSPSYKRLQGFKEFRVVTRRICRLASETVREVHEAVCTEVWPRLELAGLTGIHSAYSGTASTGRSPGVVEIDFTGKHRG